MTPKRARRAKAKRIATAIGRLAPEAVAVPLRHPAMVAALLALAASLVLFSGYRLYETDLWQHLVMGRAIWERGLPRVNLWTWPQYGEPYFLSSWGFRALVWPLWAWGGVPALFAWRWVTTLGVFALLLATARTMGARGFLALLVLAAAAMSYRLRTDVRPETLASLLLAAELWLLERHRLAPPEDTGAARHTGWIPALTCLWANAHISVYLAFVLLGFYGLDALWQGRSSGEAGARARARATRLAWVLLASLAAAFANPFGWAALSQPVQFALVWSRDPLMRTIGELQPLTWLDMLRSGLPLWPLLALVRIRRRGLDVVELLACAFATALALSSFRFSGTYAILGAPFVARDLNEWAIARRWPVPRLPLAARAALMVVVIALICLSTWRRVDLPLGVAIDPRTFPQRACDFMAAHGIRGRGLNNSSYGGYLAYRFWPDRERLPFLSTQLEYTPKEDRDRFLAALRTEAGWHALEAKHHFDYVVFERDQAFGDSLLDFLDRDPRFAMVFSDDAAELLVRRDRFPGVADSFEFRVVPAGKAARYALGPACQGNTALRRAAAVELERMIAGSPWNAGASHLRGFLALMDGDVQTARRHLERALEVDPLRPNLHDLLGSIALQQNRPQDAIRELDAERRLHEPPGGLYFRTALAWQRLGRVDRAREFYRRELARDPGYGAAADSLAAIEAHSR